MNERCNGLTPNDARAITFMWFILLVGLILLAFHQDKRLNVLEGACGVEQVEG